MNQRVFVKVLDDARLEHLLSCGECSHGILRMPCADIVSKIRFCVTWQWASFPEVHRALDRSYNYVNLLQIRNSNEHEYVY